MQVFGPVCYLITSDQFDLVLAQIFDEAADAAGAERGMARAAAEQLLGVMHARKRMFATRKPSIIAILTYSSIQKFWRTA